jgi:hypothetical protein
MGGFRSVVWFLVLAGGCKMDQDIGANVTPGTTTRVVWDMKPGKVGNVTYEIIDDATGKKMPGKLTFVGTKGTTDPRFSKGDIGREESDSTGVAAFNRVFSIDGAGAIPVPIGKYKITFSRGMEWTISMSEVEVTAAGVDIKGRLKHVIDTPKWASGDFHVHAAASPDSRVPMRDRVYEFVAEGIDMIVSTDHNVVSNYAPHIEELKVGKMLASTRGDEISSGSWGHFGAFPLPADMEKEGPPGIRRMSAQQIFDAFRADAPDAIINVHHPRLEKAIGYFWLGKFDEKRDRALRKGFSYDFDAVELLNGYQDTNRKSLDRTMADWFALLDCGHMITATGNSDTHHMTYNLGGYPRNYVQVDNDDPGVVTGKDMAKGIKARRVFFTTAPIVSFTSGTAGIGDIAPAPDGKAKVEIGVRAAPWVSISRVKLYVAGKIVKTWDVPKSEDVDRFKTTYEFTIANDTHAVVRVEGDGPLTPIVGGVGGGIPITPLALTNPIFFDKNGNKKYDPVNKHGEHLKDAKDDDDDDKKPKAVDTKKPDDPNPKK